MEAIRAVARRVYNPRHRKPSTKLTKCALESIQGPNLREIQQFVQTFVDHFAETFLDDDLPVRRALEPSASEDLIRARYGDSSVGSISATTLYVSPPVVEVVIPALKKFTLFPKLPKELRLQIWEEHAEEIPRVVEVAFDMEVGLELVEPEISSEILSTMGANDTHEALCTTYRLFPARKPLGGDHHACVESEEVTLKFLKKTRSHYLQFLDGPRIYFSPQQDTIFFDIKSLFFLCNAIHQQPQNFSPEKFVGIANVRHLATPLRDFSPTAAHALLTMTVLPSLVYPVNTLNPIGVIAAAESLIPAMHSRLTKVLEGKAMDEYQQDEFIAWAKGEMEMRMEDFFLPADEPFQHYFRNWPGNFWNLEWALFCFEHEIVYARV